MEDPSLLLFLSVLVGSGALLVTLVNTNAALVLLVFSMLLSPEIPVAALASRAVVIRFDDLLLIVVFFTWLAKLAINKQLGLIHGTPLNLPLGLFILSCVVSTAWGVMNGSVTNPAKSLFYLLKYLEYFALFFLVANATRERLQLRLFVRAMCVTAGLVGLYAYWQMATHSAGYRVTAPFEGAHGEPNTLAGYLVVMMAVCAGLGLHAKTAVQRLGFLGLAVFMMPPFLNTFSRGGYGAFLAMYVALCVFSRRYKPMLFAVLVFGVLVAPMVVPEAVTARLADTFDPRSAVRVGGVGLAESASYRVLVWRVIFDKWLESPLLGFGVTGIDFVDSQYALVLGEVGVIGMLAFVWLQWRLLGVGYRALRYSGDPLIRGLGLGFLAGLIGLILHSLAANIFIIVRIMEPFWFLAALLATVPGARRESGAAASRPFAAHSPPAVTSHV